jgi:hypothetical protein
MKQQPAIYIYSSGTHVSGAIDEASGHALPDLKNILAEKFGIAIRRIGRFIQLSLIGAADCLRKLSLRSITVPPGTAVYLASENGDMETMIQVLDSMCLEQQPPKPLSFINTVSNAACFYIGHTFQLRGESYFISSINVSFESALFMAYMDLVLQRAPAALVGSVDICTLPLSHHRRRIDAPANVALGEGSHWLWLAPALPDTKPLAQILAIEYAPTLVDVLAKISALDFKGQLALGLHLSTADKRELQNAYTDTWDYSSALPFYNSQSAYAVVNFLQQDAGSELLHVNKNREGGYYFYCLRKIY